MSKKILIIDDDPEITSYLDEMLSAEGYQTFTAKDGVDGVSKAQVHNPDLITLDMDMPGRGGTMFYVKLRQEPSLMDIPVIVISGVGPRPPAISKSVPVISKPVEQTKVLRLIKEMLGENVTE